MGDLDRVFTQSPAKLLSERSRIVSHARSALEAHQEPQERGRAPPSLLVTGCGAEERETGGIPRSMTDLGRPIKPFDPSNLLEALEALADVER